MNIETYESLIEDLTNHRRGISKGKRKDYTKDNVNVLQNFYNQSEALGVAPETALAVHMEKQFSAILTYIKTNGESESEPIKNRISDCLNYLELLWGLINDRKTPKNVGGVVELTQKQYDEYVESKQLRNIIPPTDENDYPATPEECLADEPIKVGDYVIPTTGESWYKDRDSYEVVKIDEDGDIWVIDDDGDKMPLSPNEYKRV